MELQNGIEEHRALDRFRALPKSERVSIAGVAVLPISRIMNSQKKREIRSSAPIETRKLIAETTLMSYAFIRDTAYNVNTGLFF